MPYGGTITCNKGCGTVLKFDRNVLSDSGKMIPLEAESGEPHQCPNSTYNKKGGQQKTFQGFNVKKAETEAEEGTWRHDMFASLSNIESILGVLNGKLEALRVHAMGPDKALFKPAAEDLKTDSGNEISGSDHASGPGAYVQGGQEAEEEDNAV